jgi:hypothetical protein
VSLSGRGFAKQVFWEQAVADVLVDREYSPDEADRLAAIGSTHALCATGPPDRAT